MTVNLPVPGKLRLDDWGIPLTQQCNDHDAFISTGSVRRYKDADQSVTSSTALVAATGLSIPLQASTNYIFEWYIPYFANATADFKFGFTLPTGATTSFHWDYNDSGTSARSYGYLNTVPTTGFGIAGMGFDFATHLWGSFQMSTTPGDWTPTFAQNTSNATASRLLKGSYTKVEKVLAA